MVATVSINPIKTSVARGSFNTQSDGYIQGTALDSPSIRNSLAGGVLDDTETLPMWGGVGISEKVPAGANNVLGGKIIRATSLTVNAAGTLTGFSVFDQDYAMINSPQSPVPLAGSGMQVNFYRLGSGARIPVNIDPALIDLQGGVISPLVSWDFNAQRLVPYQPASALIAITSQTWAAGVVTVVTAAPHPFVVGDDVTLIGALPVAYNGDVTILTSADNTHFTYALPADPLTSPAATPGSVAAGGGALPVEILDVQVGNCMTVDFDPVTGFADWDRSGSCAVILI